MIVSRLLRPSRPNAEKLASYESGESPVGDAWGPVNFRFYAIALVFILFEVELVFLFPWAVVLAGNVELPSFVANSDWGETLLVEMLVFIGLIVLALAYAWVNGHLNWEVPTPAKTSFTSPVPPVLYDHVNERYK